MGVLTTGFSESEWVLDVHGSQCARTPRGYDPESNLTSEIRRSASHDSAKLIAGGLASRPSVWGNACSDTTQLCRKEGLVVGEGSRLVRARTVTGEGLVSLAGLVLLAELAEAVGLAEGLRQATRALR